MNSSRLAELERQRALVREQLAWLEQEIAKETARTFDRPGDLSAEAPLPKAGAVPTGSAATPLAVFDAADAQVRPERSPDATLAQTVFHPGKSVRSELMPARDFAEYQPDPKNAAESARRGCLFAAAGVVVLLVAGFLTLYFVRYSDRPMLLPSRSGEAVKK